MITSVENSCLYYILTSFGACQYWPSSLDWFQTFGLAAAPNLVKIMELMSHIIIINTIWSLYIHWSSFYFVSDVSGLVPNGLEGENHQQYTYECSCMAVSFQGPIEHVMKFLMVQNNIYIFVVSMCIHFNVVYIHAFPTAAIVVLCPFCSTLYRCFQYSVLCAESKVARMHSVLYSSQSIVYTSIHSQFVSLHGFLMKITHFYTTRFCLDY